MARVAVWLLGCSAAHPHLAAPAAGRLRGGTRVGARVLRDLTRRGCPSGAPQAQSEFHGAPRNRPDAGLPRSEAKGSQTGGRLSFGYFSLAKQRTSTSPAGARPGPPPSAQAQAQAQQQQQQPTANSPGHHRPPNLPRVRHPEQHQANQPAHHRPIDPDVLQVLADVQLNKL